MECRFLPQEQIQSIGARARAWLIRLSQQAEMHSGCAIKQRLQILAGLWICERTLLQDNSLSATQAYLPLVSRHLTASNDIFTDLLHADPPLALLALGIMRFFHVHDQHFEAFATQISQLLQTTTDASDLADNALFLTCFLLQRLGLYARLPAYALQEMPTSTLLQTDDATVRAFAANIIAATQHGAIALSEETSFVRELKALLPTWMVYHLHQYHLEAGMQLLRCMRYLHLWQHRSFLAGLRFLVAQQQQDGRCGFLGQEIAQTPSSSDASMSDLLVYLPHTVSFLWTIAEAINPEFLLAGSF